MARVARWAAASASSRMALPAVVMSPPSLLVSTTPASMVHTVPVPLTVMSPLSPSETPPPPPVIVWLRIVLQLATTAEPSS